MSTTISALMAMALVIVGVGTLAQGVIKSITDLSDSQTQREVRSAKISRTQIQVVLTDTAAPPMVDITVENSGEEALRAFDEWDVIVQYYEADDTYHQTWLPYTTSLPPGDNQWTVEGLYLDTEASAGEKFQPNILEPEEKLVIRMKLSPQAGAVTDNQVVIGTPNGVRVSSPF